MGRSLSKFIRGGATAGAQLTMEQYRANLDTKKMEKLQQYQTGERQAEQEFRTSERVAGEKHDIELQKAGKGAGATQGDIQLMNYFQEHGIAKSPEDALKMVREMDSDPQKLIVDIAKSMQAADAQDGMGERKSFDEYLKQAETDIGSLRERLNPKPQSAAPAEGKPSPGKGLLNSNMSVDQGGMIDQALDSAPHPEPAKTGSSNLVDTVKIQNDEDYQKLAPGARYIAPDGKVRIKK